MSELSREQIIKALECHAGKFDCDKCPFDPYEGTGETYCGCIMAKNALSLIKELTEENEGLRATAEWKGGTVGTGRYGYYCSNCQAHFVGENAEWIAKEHKFCPKCGAKMKG